ncbi:MAG: protein-tyrosine-phosphatase, partial [Mesorhizobium sp.]
VEYWPMPDPTDAGGTREHIMAAYRDVRERLKARIARRFPTSEARSALD